MSLRIQCPACQRQFTVDEELRGRTVECGSCEKQFVVDQDSVVRERDRYFPGDIRKPGLKHYGVAPGQSDSTPRVDFPTAMYSESASAADVIPPAPGRTIAGVAGMVILLIYLVVLVFGWMGQGFFGEMETGKRILLSGFVIVVGLLLVFSGGLRRQKQAIMGGVGVAVAVLGLSVFMPSGDPITRAPASLGLGAAENVPSDSVRVRMSAGEARLAMTYDPIQRAIDTFGQESVWALWAPAMGQHFRYQIQRYLQRKTGSAARPAFYPREQGGLMVIEGVAIKMPELVSLVERFAKVEDVYEDLRVLRIEVKGESLLEPSSELEALLSTTGSESFIVLNRKELEHIDIDRVRDAAQRLSTVAPTRFRAEISARLVELLDEEVDSDFRSTICKAIMVWSSPGDGAEKAVVRLVSDLISSQQIVPKTTVQFLVERRSAGLVPLLKGLWEKAPLSWEGEVIAMGSGMEAAIAPSINSGDDLAAQRSALLILRRVGTELSLPKLRSALANTEKGSDVILLIERAIEGIESNVRSRGEAPEPEVKPLEVPEVAPAPEVEPLEIIEEEKPDEPEFVPQDN